MRLLITGADRPLGTALAQGLSRDFALRLTGVGPSGPPGLPDAEYTPADLRLPEAVVPLVAGMDAVIHAGPFDPAPSPARTRSRRPSTRPPGEPTCCFRRPAGPAWAASS